MSPTGTLHFVLSLMAVALGAAVMLLPKGTRWHRTWGQGYAWCMAGVVVTSFSMYGLTGRVTPFHFAALVAGVTVVGGMWTVLRRRPKAQWIYAHATWMAWSYVGLLAALVAETSTRFVMPALAGTLRGTAMWPAFWAIVLVATFGVCGIGNWLIRTRLAGVVARTPQAMRAEREALRGVDSA